MPAPEAAPAWARELALAYESGAHGQFILYGNVHDRLVAGDRLVNLARYVEDTLLAAFPVVFSYDLGNGLSIERGEAIVHQWSGAAELQQRQSRAPLAAIDFVGRYLRYLGNLRALGRGGSDSTALILRGVDHILPADGSGFEHGSLTSLVREWASEAPFCELAFASILIADNLNDLEPLVAFNPRAARIGVPLPDAAALGVALGTLQRDFAKAFAADVTPSVLAEALVGVGIGGLESLVKLRAHAGRALAVSDAVGIKKALVERDAGDLVEFVEPRRSLDDYQGQPALKDWLRADMALWRAGDLKALPKGYLLCGPVGTGKTFLVECLAGEAGVPVVRLKNFRDRWVGSSEGNLEKIFRLVRALGRCIVFVDEADQTLGRRESGGSDGGLSGRLYSMIAQEMADSANRGRVMWILASSRPDLIEVDLKRPGRIDVKIPILPTTTAAESGALLAALGRRYDLPLTPADLAGLAAQLPLLLTPGAAEALVVKAYRHARTQHVAPAAALAACLDGYQNPVPPDVLELQMRLAIREATDLSFVPPSLRALAAANGAA
ncbi:MAG: ATP-binding protein [bacterium]